MSDQKPVIVQLASGARYGLPSAAKAQEIYPHGVIVGYTDGSPYVDVPPPAREGAGDGPLTAQFDRDRLKELKLDQLKAMAVEAGANAEEVAALRAKGAVIDVLEQRIDWDATVNDDAGDDAGGEGE